MSSLTLAIDFEEVPAGAEELVLRYLRMIVCGPVLEQLAGNMVQVSSCKAVKYVHSA